MRIVIVEDEAKTRKGIVNLINKIGQEFEVIGEAGNGLEGLELITRLKPDVIFVDIKMPKINGIEMLQKLKEAGIRAKSVILSGYSDFEYAQKGIKVGVCEYLLKPATVEDIENILKKLKKDIEIEKVLENDKIQGSSSVEYILQNLVIRDSEESGDMLEFLEKVHGISINSEYIAVQVYMGICADSLKGSLKSIIAEALNKFRGIRFYFIELNVLKEIIVLIQTNEIQELERCFQNVILREIHAKRMDGVVLGWIPVKGLDALKASLNMMRNELKWSIVLGDDVLISYPKTQQIFTKLVQYPIDIENRIKAAAYAGDVDKLYKYTDDFLNWWRKDIYRPVHVIEAFLQFASSLLNVLKEVDYELYVKVNPKEVLGKIMDSLTWREIQESLTGMIGKIANSQKPDERILSLIIRKALNIIHNEYIQGISLEEVANRLNITNEYLSMLFTKETGRNFTAYLKEYRVVKAKELLLNTDLKTYEISERVGYSDPKYFSRVFKEVTGFSPVEYQRINKAN